MIDTLGDAPSESTLLRHFRTLDIPTGVREVFGRFEADYPNEMWVGDSLHGPRINGRRPMLDSDMRTVARMPPPRHFPDRVNVVAPNSSWVCLAELRQVSYCGVV